MRRRMLVLAIAGLMAVGAACATKPTGSGSGAIQHPAGSDQIVLRLAYEGGFVPVEFNLTRSPEFTLYGDGRIVTPGAQIAIYPGPALPAVSSKTVSEDGIQAILRAAQQAGLGVGDRDYSSFETTMIADAPTAVFTLSAEGRTSHVSAYALSELPDRPEGMPNGEFEARQALADLARRLTALDQWLPEGSIGPEEPFVSSGSRLFVGPYRPDDQLPQEPAAWPLATPLAAGSPDTAGYACLTVTGDDWTTVEPLARAANQLTPWTSGGDEFSVLFRPLLPDESAC